MLNDVKTHEKRLHIDIIGDSDNNSSDKNNVIEEIRGFVPDSCRIRIS